MSNWYFFRKIGFDISCKLSPRRQFAWNVKAYFLGKLEKIFQDVICWQFYPACCVNAWIHLTISQYPTALTCNNGTPLTFTTVWADSADNKLLFFLFSLERRIWPFMQISSSGDNKLETICMKCQILFPGENKKNTSVHHLLKILQ